MYLSFNCREYLYIPLKCNGKNRRRKSVTYIYTTQLYIFTYCLYFYILYLLWRSHCIYNNTVYCIRLAKELLEVIYKKKKELKKNL